MVLIVWNVCGLSGGKTKKDVLTLMTRFRSEIVGLLESKVCRRNQSKVMRSFEKSQVGISNSMA